jgi:hypothetical protein
MGVTVAGIASFRVDLPDDDARAQGLAMGIAGSATMVARPVAVRQKTMMGDSNLRPLAPEARTTYQ